jgi:hypothetical protein
MLLVPAVLLAVYALPSATKRAMLFSYTDPDVTTAFVSTFVHLTPAHLAANLLGYALVVGTTYLLSVRAGRRKTFRVVFVSLLVVLPVTLSFTNLAIVRPRVSYGFSGVVMGFFGYLPFALSRYLAVRTGFAVRDEDAPVLFFLGLSLVAVVLFPGRSVGLSVAAGSFLVAVAYLGVVVRRSRVGPVTALRALLERPGDFELFLVGTTVFLSYPFVAFPGDALGDGTVLNLYSHFLGYGLSFIAVYVTSIVGGFDFEEPDGAVTDAR